ncbi:hypothetical protein ACFVU2_18010 [Leifsonia sp. NPDC058194]|uniref:hypothetical protein n=1 Tax=Leifsonia sp. NPDC058194 TaxID=3346374 RepID=UPI0036DBC622
MTLGDGDGDPSEGAPRRDPPPREPYVGINEAWATKLFVDPSSPHAAQRRRLIHRAMVVSTVVCVVGGLGLIVVGLVAVLSN